MTKKQESRATPRQYDAAFKDEAVRMWQTSGQSAEVTARALGISEFHFYERKKRVSQVSRAAGSAGLPEGKEALQLEVLRLRQENRRLTEQRDILKKAAGILSEPPNSPNDASACPHAHIGNRPPCAARASSPGRSSDSSASRSPSNYCRPRVASRGIGRFWTSSCNECRPLRRSWIACYPQQCRLAPAPNVLAEVPPHASRATSAFGFNSLPFCGPGIRSEYAGIKVRS